MIISMKVGETQEDLEIASFFIFLLQCSCDKAHRLPKEIDSLCLWIALCVFNILCRKREIKKANLSKPFPMIVWVDLDMAGEHLDITRINNKNPKNKRSYS